MSTKASRARGSLRTSLFVKHAGGRYTETIVGERFAWSFRPHYHAGDERVRMLAGRALLRFGDASRTVEAGETVLVPAGVFHRFEPIDADGWHFASEFTAPISFVRRDARQEGGLLARIRGLLAERRSLRTDIAGIAEACAVSKGYLSRRFRHESGTSLHDFHVLLALQDAKAMLKDGCTIVEAALDAGFYDQAHLTREFVRTFGFTPGVFRAAWRAADRPDEATAH